MDTQIPFQQAVQNCQQLRHLAGTAEMLELQIEQLAASAPQKAELLAKAAELSAAIDGAAAKAIETKKAVRPGALQADTDGE